jgi:hypothetical protein
MLVVGLVPGIHPLVIRVDGSVATGNKYQHKHEEETFVKEAFGQHVDEPGRTTMGVQ